MDGEARTTNRREPAATGEPDAVEPVAEEPVFADALFRVKKKHKFKVVPAPDPALEGAIADTHAHVSMLAHRDITLARAAAYNVRFICCMTDVTEDADVAYGQLGAWMDEARAQVSTVCASAEAPLPHVRLGCGCHPHNAKDFSDDAQARLRRFLADPRTGVLGEIGLDYHYDLSPRDVQQQVFRQQLRLAQETGLPVSLHVREAHVDALRVLREEGFPQAGCILHCFNLGPRDLEPWLEHDCYIAFGGPVTFKKAEEVRESARLVPLNRLLTETDCPYMTPEPLRGRENGPEYTVFTAAKLAEVRGCAPGEERRAFLQALFENACELLDRKPTSWQNE